MDNELISLSTQGLKLVGDTLQWDLKDSNEGGCKKKKNTKTQFGLIF